MSRLAENEPLLHRPSLYWEFSNFAKSFGTNLSDVNSPKVQNASEKFKTHACYDIDDSNDKKHDHDSKTRIEKARKF